MTTMQEHALAHVRCCDRQASAELLNTNVAVRDSWQAGVRDAADAVGISVADREEVERLACGLLVVHQMNAHMLRQPSVTAWGPGEYETARQPLVFTAALLRPYIDPEV